MELQLKTLSTILAWALTWMMWRQYRARRGLHQLVWAVGLGFFSFAITLETIALSQGRWNEMGYRLWYFFGAMQGVTFLGQGTLQLLDRRPYTRRFLELLALLAVVSLALVLNAPIDFSKLPTPASASGKAFAEISAAGFATPRAWTIPFNIYGSLWLIGGAIFSGLRLFAAQKLRALATSSIAVGGLVLASAESLARFGILGLQALGFCAGLTLMFMGFLLSSLDATELNLIERLLPWRIMLYTLSGIAVMLLVAQTNIGWVIKDYPGLIILGAIVLALLLLVIAKARTRINSSYIKTS